MTATAPLGTSDPDLSYGDRITAIEPGGVEFVPLGDRHGSPRSLLWTWASPNLEFATIFVGIIAVLYFGLGFWSAVAAVVLGNLLGSITQGVLSTWGPSGGLVQMVLSRTAFGYRGNILPSGINAVMGGIGWFAVNSVSGALALAALTGLPAKLTLVVVVAAELLVAFLGHNFVHAFERLALPVLVVCFALGAISVFGDASFTTPPAAEGGGLGGFTLAFGAAFGYAAGWNPYAADYTRYLKPDTDKLKVALYAGLGLFLSCSALMVLGIASMTIAGVGQSDNIVGDFTGTMPGWIGNLVLLAIALGAVSANAINIYSGSMSFLAMGVKLPSSRSRAMVALGFGALGLVLAWNGLADAGHNYEAFLLVIAYWVSPWIAIVLVDRWLQRGRPVVSEVGEPGYVNWAGPIAMVVGIVVSVWLFSYQEQYVGVIPDATGDAFDITAIVGFVIAGGLYAVLFPLLNRTSVAAD